MQRLVVLFLVLALSLAAVRADVPLESPRIIAAYTDAAEPAYDTPPYLRRLRVELYLACLADAVTTTGALRRGAVETDPLLGPVVHHPAALIGTELLWAWWLPRFLARTYPHRPDRQALLLRAAIITHSACAVQNTWQH